MRQLRKLLKIVLYILLIPVTYIVVALILSAITVNNDVGSEDANKLVFLNTNGVHLEIIIPVEEMAPELREGLSIKNASYLSFGWGEENFYLNTPEWSDLTFKNAFKALFIENSTLVHITRYNRKKLGWTEVKLSDKQLKLLNNYLHDAFKIGANKPKIILEGKGYSSNDDFYRAKGSYSCFRTCNSWVNAAFKESELKSCYWTPFDFGLLNKYRE